jgi:hypothetical protein
VIENPHLMTPDQMAAIVCPMGVGQGTPGRFVRIGNVEVGRPCIASKCAAWRWNRQWEDETVSEELPAVGYSETHGYCGMIGP